VAVVGAAMAVFAWSLIQSSEPYHGGKPLSFWLKQYATYSSGFGGTNQPEAQWPEVDTALRSIGTNAVPDLLRMLAARDSAMKLKIITLAQKQSVVPVHFIPAAERRREALQIFGYIRMNGVSAVPGLIKLLRNPEAAVRASAAIVLADIGPGAKAAVPELVRALKDTDFHVKSVAWDALWEIDPLTVDRIRAEERAQTK